MSARDDNGSSRASPTAGGKAHDAFYNRSTATSSNAIEIPKLALPQGGGALRGIDEKFTVNAVNGTAGISVPLPSSGGRGAPSIALRYNSGTGNGCFGLGWAADLPTIQRRTDKQLPRYCDADESDVFMLAGAEDLVPALDALGAPIETVNGGFHVKRYRPRIEVGFARIERIWREGDPAFYWKVTASDNSVTFYGLTAAARLADPDDPRRVARWLPELGFDDKGTVVVYHYKAEDGAPGPSGVHDRNRYDDQGQPRFANRYLKRISYGNREPWYPGYTSDPSDLQSLYAPSVDLQLTFAMELVFDYGEHGAEIVAGATQATITYAEQVTWPAREDAFSDFRYGFEVRTLRLCRRILMFHRFDELGPAPTLVRSLDLQFASALPGTVQPAEVTYLVGATSRGYTRHANDLYDLTSVPSASYEYRPLCWDTTVHDVAPSDAVHAPEGIGGDYQWVDLWGEGINGILAEKAGALYYESNLGGGSFTAAQAVAPKPSLRGLGSNLSLQDLDADGCRQLVSRTRELAGYYELDAENCWNSFRAFPCMPTLNVSDAGVLQLDLDGDGRADLLVSEQCAMRWYPSYGRDGYGEAQRVPLAEDEEKGPLQIYSDPIQRIFLADMSGDGLSDLVRIRNGEVCYWPNLGYGRFGAKITMSGAPTFAPPEQFDPRYLQLIDVTGTGATDVVYVDAGQATVWLNLSGNRWSAPQIIALPETARPNRLTCNDFLGRGTACLVWSSPLPGESHAPLRYIDILGGSKPHVLVAYENGMGKRVSLEYRSSTELYLDAKRAGTPWRTRLPFPVQCVVRVETHELVTDAVLVQEYSYYHGYYDHTEREFRGFGRVDVRDTESFSRWVRQDASNLLDERFHQPVVLTRTWYHTGALVAGGDPLAIFAGDYWTANPELLAISGVDIASEPALPATELPSELDPRELREAVRACKGVTLRREIFALDAPEQGATDAQRIAELTPFSVTTHTLAIRRLQPRAANRYAVFASHQCETLELSHERDPADARISHTVTLEVDAYGNALSAVTAVYGRQLSAAPTGTPDRVWTAQKQTHLILTETRMTDDDLTSGSSGYRLPVTCETRMFELSGVTIPPAGQLLQVATLREMRASAIELGYEQVAPADGKQYKRLIEAKRTLFAADDLASPRPLGTQSPLGLPFESYQLAMTAQVLRTLFEPDKISDVDLESWFGDQAKYVHFDDKHGISDTSWWIRSGTSDYLEPKTAQKRFYRPAGYIDARGTRTSVFYLGEDATRANATAHWQLVARREDDVGNESRVLAYDFRSLKPLLLQDPNGNLTEVVLDDLGRVIATAMMGKGSDADRLDELKAALSDRAAQATASQQLLATGDIASATWLLQSATTRWVYDDFSVPRCAVHIARERHSADLEVTGDALKLQLGFEYTGGAGNVVMKKAQAAPGDAWTIDAQNQKVMVSASRRWAGSGRTVFNNKGQPIKQYEPYYSATHSYETDRLLTDVGVSPIHTYDALGRHLRTDFPDGTYGHTQFDAWSQRVFDGNDTVKTSGWYATRMALAADDPQRIAAQQTELHDGTPLTVYLDSLGRSMCSIAHNRGKNGDGVVEEAFLDITATLDIEGNVLAVTDPRGATVMEHRYDLLGRPLYRKSPDAGERWILQDVAGATLYSWDSREQRLRSTFDAIGRPLEQWLSIAGAAEISLGRTVWGEAAPDTELHNLRGQAWKTYDQSGCVTVIDCDFKGNVLESQRRFADVYDQTIAWPENDPDAILDEETFRTRTVYDALGRPRQAFSPDNATVIASEVLPGYDESGLLVRVDVKLRGAADATPFMTDARYDAKGQRLSVTYGNGTATTYEYDPETFRLSHLVTTRPNAPAVQDLSWAYDPVASVVSIADAAQPTTYFNSIPVTASQRFEYDALYRLISAQGREHIGQNLPTDPWDGARTQRILPEDAQAMQRYEERYEYDLAGNLTKLIHAAGSGTSFVNRWTRLSSYDATSNRLVTSEVGGVVSSYSHNPHGSMTSMPHLQVMEWDPAEHLQHVKQGTLDAYYSYDPSGQRTRKVVVKQGGRREVRLYLGGFEVFRQYNGGDLELARETLHVMDGTKRIALVETRTAGDDGSPERLVRFQHTNHLGSACVETDEQADVITYEEYFPYGSTSWQAGRSSLDTVLKRYRYCGLERDEESGFGYHGNRYYAPWLGRWTSADPIGIDDGLNVYSYVSGNPVSLKDPSGTTECDPTMATCNPDDELPNVYEDSVEEKEQRSSEVGHMVDENRYNMAVLHEAVRTKTVIQQPFDLKKQAEAALKGTQTPEYKANQALALRSSYPQAPERTFWNRGGTTLVMGGGMVVLGVGGIFTGGGTWFLLGAAMTTAGGVAGVGVGGVQLATSGTRTYQQDAEINHATDTMFILSSPSGLAGGSAGLIYYGSEEGMFKGAAAAGITDLGLSLGARGAAWAYFNNPYQLRFGVLAGAGEGAILLPTVTLVERSALELRARAIQYKLYTSGTLSFFEATRKSSIAILDVGPAWIIAHQNEKAWLALINEELHLAPYETVASMGPYRVGGKLVHSDILAAEEAAHWGYTTGSLATYPRGCVGCQFQLKLDYPGIIHLNPAPW